MVLIVAVFMGLASLAGVLFAAGIGYGLFRWIGSVGAWIGVGLLVAGVAVMLYVLRDVATSLNAYYDSERMMAQWMMWLLGLPCALGVLLSWWLAKLALSK